MQSFHDWLKTIVREHQVHLDRVEPWANELLAEGHTDVEQRKQELLVFLEEQLRERIYNLIYGYEPGCPF